MYNYAVLKQCLIQYIRHKNEFHVCGWKLEEVGHHTVHRSLDQTHSLEQFNAYLLFVLVGYHTLTHGTIHYGSPVLPNHSRGCADRSGCNRDSIGGSSS